MSTPTTLLPFQPPTMSTAQLAAVSFPARYSARTHHLYSFQLREWFAWCERNGLDRLELIQFLQVAQAITVHHGALAYLLGINSLRASEAAGVRIEGRAGGRHPAAHQPPLAAPRGDHQRVGCRGAPSRRADPRPPCRPQNH